MRFLADTQVLVWYVTDPDRLSAQAVAAMQASIDAEEPVGVSAFSLVELAYAAEKKSNAIGSGQFTSILAVQALRSGGEAGQAMIDRLSGGSGSAPVGWTSGTHWFDYNLDRLGLGTIDDPSGRSPTARRRR